MSMDADPEGPKAQQLKWSSQFTVVKAPSSLHGDKIILPSTALEQLLDAAPQARDLSAPARLSESFDPFNPYSVAAQRHARSQYQAQERKLSQPLTFRLVNPGNNRVVYAGVTEFSAEDGHVALSSALLQALGLETPMPTWKVTDDDDHRMVDGEQMQNPINDPSVTVHYEALPKGVFVKLRPLEAGYDPEDWKALLESYLRSNYTTLTKGEVLTVRANATEAFQFLVDELKPDGNGICVVDTDLEVDIEALNEEQARETLKRYAKKHRLAPGTEQGSSSGGELSFLKSQSGQVLPGDYVDYKLDSWPRDEGVQIDLDVDDENEQGQVDLLVSPFSAYQRAQPREDEHTFADFADRPSKRVKLSPSNVEIENAESLYVAVHAVPSLSKDKDSQEPRLQRYNISVSPLESKSLNDAIAENMNGPPQPGPDEVICSNCKHAVPKQSLVLHEIFCRRNNVKCPYSSSCNRVFQRNSPALKEHWHCDQERCSSSGSSEQTKQHHLHLCHTPVSCPSCSYPDPFPSMSLLAQHRVSVCPAKHILCRFCHLSVQQEGTGDDPFAAPDPEVVLSGMTAHEVADGARTTECHMCSRIVRLRDMETHLKNHDFERRTRPVPRVCRNVLCGRTLDGANASGDTRSASRVGQGPGNDVGLCSACFAPLYVTTHDPEGKALKRRVERRYLSQLTAGCGKSWCRNPFCKSGKTALAKEGKGDSGDASETLTIGEAIPIAKPYVDGLLGDSGSESTTPLHFCTDESNQRRRGISAMLAAGDGTPGAKQYRTPWCIAALEAQKGDLKKAQEWLHNFAPTAQEEGQRS